MASEGQKTEVSHDKVLATPSKLERILPVLRLLAFFATLSATIVMALNKQTRTITVATIGTVPIQATLTAKFNHTPANVFFVITNGNASLHNLLMLAVCLVEMKFDKRLAPLTVTVLDLMNVAILSAGTSAATFMGQLGRDGNSHAHWNKICDKFESYCDRGRGAMLASSIGLMLMITITILSIIRLRTHNYNKLVRNLSAVP